MGELVIQYHDFENAKNEIKKFSKQTKTDLDLKKVDDSKGVGEFLGDWFLGRGIGKDHIVKGEELNDLTSQIQTHLQSINNTQIKLIKEFGQVYIALQALDKDYIQAILVSIKATEETSEGVQKTQEQLKKIVENQRKTLEELKNFKQKLDGYAHLGDIDKIWGDCQKWHQEMASLSKDISTAHDSIKNISGDIEEIQEVTSKHQEEINKILAFTEKVSSLKHLMDIDSTWNTVNEHSEQLIEVEKQNDDIVNSVHKSNIAIESLTKRIKYAYWIAGSSAGLAIIELILLLIKVI